VILISPQNQVLLIQKLSLDRPSPKHIPHVFPGGTISQFHDGLLPPDPRASRYNRDNILYRRAAIREVFEETGILLARKKDGSPGLLKVADEERLAGRCRVHADDVRFTDLVDDWGGIPDTGK
jgi:8-oxo-dGTP pyrophosphatase MutT (NUDIX family)